MMRKIILITFMLATYFFVNSQTINKMARTPKEFGANETINSADSHKVNTMSFEKFETSNFPPTYWSTSVSSKWDTASFQNQYRRYARCRYIADYEFNDLLIFPKINYSKKTINDSVIISFMWRGSAFWSMTEDSCDLKFLISIDDGNNWDTIWTEETNPQWNSWSWNTTRLNISSNVAGQANVKFAFLYKGRNGAEFDIDEIKVFPTIYDIKLSNSNPLYTQYPVKQAANINLGAKVKNTGLREVTNLTLNTKISNTTIYENFQNYTVPSLACLDSQNIVTISNFQTIIRGEFNLIQSVSVFEQLGNFGDDYLYPKFSVTDTVYARDNGIALSSLGKKTDSVNVIGQIFNIVNADTLNSVSVFLNSPTKNDSFQVTIYNFTTQPDTIYYISSMIVADTSQSKWYNVSMNGLYLQTGLYYVAIIKNDTSNIPVGTSDNFAPNTVFVMKNSNWVKAEDINNSVSLMIRLNTRYDALYVSNGSSTDIEENNIESNILVYPNPAKDKFSLFCKSKIVELSIYDISGRLITKTNPNRNSIDVTTDDLFSGVYFIHIKTDKQNYNKKLIISK